MSIYQKIKRAADFYSLKILWKRLNKHNSTYPGNFFDHELVKVGLKSYGELSVFSFGNLEEKLIIGNYVSIAEGVKFYLGGNHSINSIFNFPLKSIFVALDPSVDAQTKGAIEIDDEVWIGSNCTILSGVKVGRGCIIGASSVVVKDLPAFSIAVGNPAKVIKMRFSEETIKLMKNIHLVDLDDDFIKKNISSFYHDAELNHAFIKTIEEYISNRKKNN